MEHLWFNGTLYVFMRNMFRHHIHVHSIHVILVKMVSTLEPWKSRNTTIYIYIFKMLKIGT